MRQNPLWRLPGVNALPQSLLFSILTLHCRCQFIFDFVIFPSLRALVYGIFHGISFFFRSDISYITKNYGISSSSLQLSRRIKPDNTVSISTFINQCLISTAQYPKDNTSSVNHRNCRFANINLIHHNY